MSPYECDTEFWVQKVAQGTWKGLEHGRRPDSKVPEFLLEEGPLRTTLLEEMAFRSVSETYATKACALASAAADIWNIPGVEFFATQALDEARHAYTFRHHLVDLGIPEDQLLDKVRELTEDNVARMLTPMWDWGLEPYRNDFPAGVVIITILLEGVLAPTTELAEKKWKAISPATADIERGACVDEVRHLAVGSWFVRNHLDEHPDEKDHILDVIVKGREKWTSLPIPELVMRREQLYQQGLEAHRDKLGDSEIVPGRRVVDTTAEERLGYALDWSREVQEARLRYMGLEEAIPPAGSLV